MPRLAGRYVFGDYCSGTIWSIPQLTSFGESLSGATLYAVSGAGTVYRFTR